MWFIYLYIIYLCIHWYDIFQLSKIAVFDEILGWFKSIFSCSNYNNFHIDYTGVTRVSCGWGKIYFASFLSFTSGIKLSREIVKKPYWRSVFLLNIKPLTKNYTPPGMFFYILYFILFEIKLSTLRIFNAWLKRQNPKINFRAIL